ncbi:MAG: C40 family peptidase [Ignavibacteria bacterium]|nr:C40 family peptidase [Ignavibacteria bacterium]
MRKFFSIYASTLILVALFALVFPQKSFTKIKKAKKQTINLHSKKQNLLYQSLIKLKTYLLGFENISFDNISNIHFTSPSKPINIFSNNYLKEKLLNNILLWLGTPYKLAGSSKSGVDCSNFVAQIISKTLSIHFPANAETQSKLFTPIYDLKELTFGDLIFFSGTNRKSKRIGHVGIYLGNGIFAHSSTGRGVIITHISEGYYSERFRFGGRFSKGLLNIVSK